MMTQHAVNYERYHLPLVRQMETSEAPDMGAKGLEGKLAPAVQQVRNTAAKKPPERTTGNAKDRTGMTANKYEDLVLKALADAIRSRDKAAMERLYDLRDKHTKGKEIDWKAIALDAGLVKKPDHVKLNATHGLRSKDPLDKAASAAKFVYLSFSAYSEGDEAAPARRIVLPADLLFQILEDHAPEAAWL